MRFKAAWSKFVRKVKQTITRRRSAGRTGAHPLEAPQGRRALSLDHLPFDCLLQICTALAYADSQFVQDELVEWPDSSTSTTLRHLCLVSRRLLEPAQATLFRSAAFETFEQCKSFLRTVAARPDLASRVIAVQIGRMREQDGEDIGRLTLRSYRKLTGLMLDAVEKCTSCRHLRIFPLTQPVGMRVLDLIKDLPLHSLVLRVYDVHQELSEEACIFIIHSIHDVVIAHPALRSFEYAFNPSVVPPLSLIAPLKTYTSHLTAFHVVVNVPADFFACIEMMVSTLKILSLYTPHRLDPAIARPLFRRLDLHVLRFESIVPGPEAEQATANYWLSDVIPDYKHLTRLSLSEQDASPALFAHPPLQLELLEYISFSTDPQDQFNEFASIAFDPNATLCAPTCIFVADETAFKDRVDAANAVEVIEAFRSKGVKFIVRCTVQRFLQREMVEL